jgi:hypothetical protein
MCIIHEALTTRRWVSDIQGALKVGVIIEFLHLWDILSNFELQPEVSDIHFWRFTANGQYSAKVAHEGLFLGSIRFEPFERIWKTWAPPKCHFFLWLVAQRKCWTTDHLARSGLNHPDQCPMCDKEDESIDHLLILCIFARQFWITFLWQVNLDALSPQPEDVFFSGMVEKNK